MLTLALVHIAHKDERTMRFCNKGFIIAVILDKVFGRVPLNSRGVSTPEQLLLLTEQTDTDNHSDTLGNVEQTALLLNTLFMLLLPAEFSHNVTA